MLRTDNFERSNLLRLGRPMVITGYSTVLMLVTDALMVGRLGPEELAAVAPSGLLISLWLIVGSETMTSVNTLAATSIGMRKPEEAGKYLWQGLMLSLAFGLIALASAWAAPFIFGRLMPAQEPRVLELEISYYQICLWSVLPLTLTATLNHYFLACGKAALPMLSSIGGELLNGVCNGVLIFGFGPIPAMGFAGAAWGTVIASGVQAGFLMGCLWLHGGLREYGSRSVGVQGEKMLRTLKFGLPSGVQGGVDLFSWGVMLTWLIGHFGYKHLAAQTILAACIRFSFAPAAGLGSALATLVGHAQGERNFLLAKRYARLAFGMIAWYMTAMALIYMAGRYWILRAFTDDPEVIAIGSAGMIYVALFQFFDAMNVTYINALQGAGDTSWPTAWQFILTIVILVGGGLGVIRFFPHWESMGVWLVAAVYVICQGLMFQARWKNGRWRMVRVMGKAGAAC